jgi:hypothetical protein
MQVINRRDSRRKLERGSISALTHEYLTKHETISSTKTVVISGPRIVCHEWLSICRCFQTLLSVLVAEGVSTIDGTVLIARWPEYDTWEGIWRRRCWRHRSIVTAFDWKMWWKRADNRSGTSRIQAQTLTATAKEGHKLIDMVKLSPNINKWRCSCFEYCSGISLLSNTKSVAERGWIPQNFYFDISGRQKLSKIRNVCYKMSCSKLLINLYLA